MANNENALAPGTRIADYEIIEVLGEPGSFGITYRATDLHLRRDVALKEYFPGEYAYRRGDGAVVPKDEGRHATFEWGLERFSEEARTLAQFDHRNIVKVLRLVAEINGTAYIVMELVRGRTLEAIIEQQGPMEAAKFSPVFERLLDGCAAIHRIGILHRDIKPTNIIITDAGEPVLIDFGAARDLALQKKSGFTAIVTDTYSPPEQYSREQAQGPWTDIYALAATAYYALSGGAPPPSTARAVGDYTKPAVEAAAGRADAKLLKGLDWGLSLAARDRPQTIDDWRQALDLEPSPLVPARARLDRRAVIALGVGATALGGLGAIMALTSGGGGPGRVLDERAAPFGVKWTRDLGSVGGGDPWAAVAATPHGVIVAGQRQLDDGMAHMLAVRLSNDGSGLREWQATEPRGAAQTVVAARDGGAFVGGEQDGLARIVRLGPDWATKWSRTYGEGEVRSLLEHEDGVIAAIGTGFDTGRAKLVFISKSGDPSNEVSLLDRLSDTVERVAALPDGGLAVLGRRVSSLNGLNKTQLWLARLDKALTEVWRVQEAGLGTARGWAIGAVGDDIFVVGTSAKGGANDMTHLLTMRVKDGQKDGQIVWTKVEESLDNGSGRALAIVSAGGKPIAYLAGTGGKPGSKARFAQLRNNGDMAWSVQAPAKPAAVHEGAIALAFRAPGDGFAAGFTFDGVSARLTVSRLLA